ncbi:MAG TPA: hypothetical protein VGP44_06930 [Gemmatimonadales bacterium]|nr:hypothetical protein [Gemmatimonadales bacterium]
MAEDPPGVPLWTLKDDLGEILTGLAGLRGEVDSLRETLHTVTNAMNAMALKLEIVLQIARKRDE